MVPGVGVEPTWPCGRGILSPLRLPVSPPGRSRIMRGRRERSRLASPSRKPMNRKRLRVAAMGRSHRTETRRGELEVRGSRRRERSQHGGQGRNRTGVRGFAGRCMTTLPPGHADFGPRSGRVVELAAAALKRQDPGGPRSCFVRNWSGKRDSNSRPRPWQGRALPTELFPRGNAHHTEKSRRVNPDHVQPGWRPSSCARMCGHAARTYMKPDHSVSAAARINSPCPNRYIGRPTKSWR
jgi:hypothetical protein